MSQILFHRNKTNLLSGGCGTGFVHNNGCMFKRVIDSQIGLELVPISGWTSFENCGAEPVLYNGEILTYNGETVTL